MSAVTSAAPARRRAPRRTPAWQPPAVALGLWAALAVVGLALRPALAAGALHPSHQALPLAVGATLVLVGAGWLAARGLGDLGSGVVLGLGGGWVSFTVLTVLAGTPIGIGGLVSDCGRTAAAAERFTTTWTSADQFLQGLPSQYPPLYFWLWGRAAALTGQQSWQVMAQYQGVVVGLVVVLTGLAWRLTSRSWRRALAAAAIGAGVFLTGDSGSICKTHESAAYLIGAPLLFWASCSVSDVVRTGRLGLRRAAVWGALVGVLLTVYQLPVLFGVPPLLVLWAVWAYAHRHLLPALAHVGTAVAAAFVTSAWYVVPFAVHLVTDRPGPRHPDGLMVVSTLEQTPGPPAAVFSVAGVAATLGLVLVLARLGDRRAQTAVALLLGTVVLSAAAYWNVVRGGETFYSYRSVFWVLTVLTPLVALLAPPLRVWRDLLARQTWAVGTTSATGRRFRAAAALAALLLAMPGAFLFWAKVHPPIVPLQTAGLAAGDPAWNSPAALAYRTPLESCQRPEATPADWPMLECYPASTVQRLVDDTLGAGARPIVLGVDRSSVFAPYFQIVPQNGGATFPLDRYDERLAVVRGLASIRDPAAFRAATAGTPFGAVQVFILRTAERGQLRWTAQAYLSKEVVTFSRVQFPDSLWATATVGKNFVAVARPAPGGG